MHSITVPFYQQCIRNHLGLLLARAGGDQDAGDLRPFVDLLPQLFGLVTQLDTESLYGAPSVVSQLERLLLTRVENRQFVFPKELSDSDELQAIQALPSSGQELVCRVGKIGSDPADCSTLGRLTYILRELFDALVISLEEGKPGFTDRVVMAKNAAYALMLTAEVYDLAACGDREPRSTVAEAPVLLGVI